MDFLKDMLNLKDCKLKGIILGILVGIIIIVFGFFNTLFITFCAFIGWLVGNAIDKDVSIREMLKKILPPGYR